MLSSFPIESLSSLSRPLYAKASKHSLHDGCSWLIMLLILQAYAARDNSRISRAGSWYGSHAQQGCGGPRLPCWECVVEPGWPNAGQDRCGQCCLDRDRWPTHLPQPLLVSWQLITIIIIKTVMRVNTVGLAVLALAGPLMPVRCWACLHHVY